MIRIYLSGKISDMPLEKSQRNFSAARKKALKYYTLVLGMAEADIEIINPHHIRPAVGVKKWLFYMISDIKVMRTCTDIFHLKDWAYSPGATIEHYVGLKRGMKVRYQNECERELKSYYIEKHKNKSA